MRSLQFFLFDEASLQHFFLSNPFLFLFVSFHLITN
uniref:CPSF100 (CLEAVAGE AND POLYADENYLATION SPECIFICITY FACTOR 100) n=1 Tax=Arundo donax TaxID=35708 RepID=A0A0A9A2H7_ARUDO